MKKKKNMKPKVKLQFDHVLVTTNGPKSSVIKLENSVKTKTLFDVQEVIACGELLQERGVIKEGDKVILDVDKMFAKRANGGSVRMINLLFSKTTGEYISSENADEFTEEDYEHYLLISSREILAVL